MGSVDLACSVNGSTYKRAPFANFAACNRRIFNSMTQTERVVHDFVRKAISRLSEALSVVPAKFEYVTRWERGIDGHFRECIIPMRTLWQVLSNECWLRCPNIHRV